MGTPKIVIIAIIMSVVEFLPVNTGVVTLRIDEHEKACFGYNFEKDAGEVSADIQVF